MTKVIEPELYDGSINASIAGPEPGNWRNDPNLQARLAGADQVKQADTAVPAQPPELLDNEQDLVHEPLDQFYKAVVSIIDRLSPGKRALGIKALAAEINRCEQEMGQTAEGVEPVVPNVTDQNNVHAKTGQERSQIDEITPASVRAILDKIEANEALNPSERGLINQARQIHNKVARIFNNMKDGIEPSGDDRKYLDEENNFAVYDAYAQKLSETRQTARDDSDRSEIVPPPPRISGTIKKIGAVSLLFFLGAGSFGYLAGSIGNNSNSRTALGVPGVEETQQTEPQLNEALTTSREIAPAEEQNLIENANNTTDQANYSEASSKESAHTTAPDIPKSPREILESWRWLWDPVIWKRGLMENAYQDPRFVMEVALTDDQGNPLKDEAGNVIVEYHKMPEEAKNRLFNAYMVAMTITSGGNPFPNRPSDYFANPNYQGISTTLGDLNTPSELTQGCYFNLPPDIIHKYAKQIGYDIAAHDQNITFSSEADKLAYSEQVCATASLKFFHDLMTSSDLDISLQRGLTSASELAPEEWHEYDNAVFEETLRRIIMFNPQMWDDPEQAVQLGVRIYDGIKKEVFGEGEPYPRALEELFHAILSSVFKPASYLKDEIRPIMRENFELITTPDSALNAS